MRDNMSSVQANERESRQGIQHIRASTRSIKHSMLQENEDENQQGIEHIRYSLISSKHSELVQPNADENLQGIDHIRECVRFTKHSEVVQDREYEYQKRNQHIPHSPTSVLDSEVIQENEDENEQGIEHIRYCLISSKHSEVAKTNEEVNQQGSRISKNVQNQPRHTAGLTEFPEAWREPEDVHQQHNNYKDSKKLSTLFDELLDLIENGDLLREEKPTLRFQVLKVIKLLHHYGVDTIRRGVEHELEDIKSKV
ncbi:hypothetical protein AgCh_012908 [Apium graveolens]